MARKQSGGFGNKLLNFIGLVDDNSNQDEYTAEDYGRPSTYVPQKQRTSRPGQSAASAASNRRSLPAQAGRSSSGNRSTGRTYGEESYNAYRANRYGANPEPAVENDYYDYEPRSAQNAAPRRTSRFDDYQEPVQRAAQPPVQRNVRVSARQRTVMCSLHTLEDCCEVIDQLISNNTIVLTMDELDGRLMQRAVDTLSGAVFALHATIRKASDKTYLIAPTGVEVNETYDVERRF